MASIQAGPTYVKTLPLNGWGIQSISEGTDNFKIVVRGGATRVAYVRGLGGLGD